MNTIEIKSLFDKWNSTLQTGTAKEVTNLYQEDAILLPTISSQTRRNHQEIEEYFIQFLAKKPKGEINQSNIRHLGKIAINSGTYTFTFGDGSKIEARYTFVYQWNDEEWKIIEHHSSVMP
jgi:uncharacterized protein (TIGR02246 family)